MKKIFLISMTFIFFTILLNKAKSENIEYKCLSMNQLHHALQGKLRQHPEVERFTIYHDEKYTYILYKADHKPNEYMNTDLTLHKRNGKFVVNAVITNAMDESSISVEKIIRFKKVPKKDIELNEIDKR